MKIGFFGLGIMGSRMAANLLKAGFDLVVYNRSMDKAVALLKAGAEWGNTVKDTAAGTDILYTMLSTPEIVEEVASGPEGILDNMKPGAIWTDCTTVNPAFSKKMAIEATQRNIRFIDAPVAGSLVPAEKGELLFLLGGNKNDIEECRPCIEAMGRGFIHAGLNGAGSSMKMLVNMLMGINMAAFSEAIHLGASLGLDKDTLVDQLLELPVTAPILNLKKENFHSNEFKTEFPLKWMQKDLHLASLCAYEEGISLPVENAVKEVFARAVQSGLGDEDFSAVFGMTSSKGFGK